MTSNRPDCLGHIGIAREIAVLWGSELTIPAAGRLKGKTPVDKLVKVRIDCPDLCLRYTARVIRGVKIGPSPRWMARRLEAVGLTPINNVVDISNYVLMECGQPLHTFDFGKLTKGKGTGPRAPTDALFRGGDHRPPPAAGRGDRGHRPQDLRARARDVHDLRRPASRWRSAG